MSLEPNHNNAFSISIYRGNFDNVFVLDPLNIDVEAKKEAMSNPETLRRGEQRNLCPVCGSSGSLILKEDCTFCNGQGEFNLAGYSFIIYHFCLCNKWGGRFCPVCRSKCHHHMPLAWR